MVRHVCEHAQHIKYKIDFCYNVVCGIEFNFKRIDMFGGRAGVLHGFAFLLVVCFAGALGGVSAASDKCREADNAFRSFIHSNFGPGETHYGGGVLHQLGPSGHVFSAAAGKLKGYGTDGANMTSTSTMSIASVTKLGVCYEE